MIRLNKHLEAYENIIFDYNGTLLYDTDWCVDCLSLLMIDQGLKPLTSDEYRESFYFPVENFYRDIGFDFSKTPFSELGKRYHSLYLARPDKMHLYNGVIELLTQLKSSGKKIAILTALKETLLFEQLQNFKIAHLFDIAMGLSDINAKSKIDRGRELLSSAQFNPKKTVIIGDTTHDAEVALALGCDIILLADGHQTFERQEEFAAQHKMKIKILELNRTFTK